MLSITTFYNLQYMKLINEIKVYNSFNIPIIIASMTFDNIIDYVSF